LASDDESLELKLAKAAYAEAEQIKKAAAQDRAAAEYALGQADHRLRATVELERGITERERRLKDELNEAALLARERALDEREKRIEELTALYDKDRHEALRALTA
jgi:hypothetical protein